MEITVNIPQNNFVKQTEVRQDVVQRICDHILDYIDCVPNVGTYSFSISDSETKSPQFYVIIRKDGSTSGFCSWDDPLYKNKIRVRTCEMALVFDVLQKGGYFIFGSYCTSGYHSYTISRRDYFDGRKATRMDFTLPID